jgi:hypothetical protein
LWKNCWNSKLECKFMIGLSQGFVNGCIGHFIKNIDLNGVNGNVQRFGWPYCLHKLNYDYKFLFSIYWLDFIREALEESHVTLTQCWLKRMIRVSDVFETPN